MKSNVGEKTIIKRATVEPIAQSNDAEINAFTINNNEGLIETYQGLGGYEEEIERYKKEIDSIKFALEAGEWYQELRYIPIYEDLNGKKTVGENKATQCVDPSLTTAEKERLSGYPVYEAILNKGKGRKVVDEINRQICAEFAVWDE